MEESTRTKRSVYVAQAETYVKKWRKCCLDSSRGSLITPRWTAQGNGSDIGDGAEYEAFVLVEEAISDSGLNEHRPFFAHVAVDGWPFVDSRRGTTDEQRRAWRILLADLSHRIWHVETERARRMREASQKAAKW